VAVGLPGEGGGAVGGVTGPVAAGELGLLGRRGGGVEAEQVGHGRGGGLGGQLQQGGVAAGAAVDYQPQAFMQQAQARTRLLHRAGLVAE
jgi:hypothetical protein